MFCLRFFVFLVYDVIERELNVFVKINEWQEL